MRPKLKWLASALLSSSAFAQEGAGGLFDFFAGRDIDYWNEGRMVPDPLHWSLEPKASHPSESAPLDPSLFSGSSVVRAADASPFAWSRYEDPKRAEFWDDGGDWIPPRPFREAASNPSPENVRRYLAWQHRKAQVTQRFQEALVKLDQPGLEQETKIPWRKLHITYFYQSLCSHCQASQGFVNDLQKKGVSFTFVQLDYGQNPPLHEPSLPYQRDLSQGIPIDSTPTWIIRVGSQKIAHVGELSLKELLHRTPSLFKEERKP